MGTTGSKKEKQEGPDFTIPTGLYHSIHWDLRAVKRMILNKRLAPLYQGHEEPQNIDHFEECPICFLFYPGGLNRSICCKKGICTECFLQIKKPNGQAFCPFCQRGNYSAVFTGPLSKEEKDKEALEQKLVNEAKIRMRNEEIEEDLRREKLRRERVLTSSSMGYDNQTSPSSASPPPEPEISISQSLPVSSPLNGKDFLDMSTSYPPPTKKTMELDDLMFQETVRFFLMNRGNSSDTETLSDRYSEEQEDSSETQREDLELALALALSNVIK